MKGPTAAQQVIMRKALQTGLLAVERGCALGQWDKATLFRLGTEAIRNHASDAAPEDELRGIEAALLLFRVAFKALWRDAEAYAQRYSEEPEPPLPALKPD